MTETTSPGANGRWRRFSLLLAFVAGLAGGVLASSLLDGRRGPRFRDRDAAAERRDRDADREGRSRGRSRGDADRESRGRSRGGDDRAQRFREQLETSLDLDESQRALLAEFLERNRAEASTFWEETRERYRELRLRFRGQIRDMLNDEQREAFDALGFGADSPDAPAAPPPPPPPPPPERQGGPPGGALR